MAAATAFMQRTVTFLTEVRAELRKVTWPDRPQLKQATIAVSIFVLIIGIIIWVMDLIFYSAFVRLLPAIFGVR